MVINWSGGMSKSRLATKMTREFSTLNNNNIQQFVMTVATGIRIPPFPPVKIN